MAKLRNRVAVVGSALALATGSAVTTQAVGGRCGGSRPSGHEEFLLNCYVAAGVVWVLRETDVEACINPITRALVGDTPIWINLEEDENLTLKFEARTLEEPSL